jgi:hypothetical protein
VKPVARAFRYQRLADERRYASISEMAAAERIERGYQGLLLRLTLLALEIVEAMLHGQALSLLGVPQLLKSLPRSWVEQRSVFTRNGDA